MITSVKVQKVTKFSWCVCVQYHVEGTYYTTSLCACIFIDPVNSIRLSLWVGNPDPLSQPSWWQLNSAVSTPPNTAPLNERPRITASSQANLLVSSTHSGVYLSQGSWLVCALALMSCACYGGTHVRICTYTYTFRVCAVCVCDTLVCLLMVGLMAGFHGMIPVCIVPVYQYSLSWQGLMKCNKSVCTTWTHDLICENTSLQWFLLTDHVLWVTTWVRQYLLVNMTVGRILVMPW